MKQIKENVYLLQSGKFVNAYAIVRKTGVVLIDTATPGKSDSILKELAGIHIKPSDIKAIVITHAHPDHAGSCKALADKLSAKIYVHKDDADVLLGKAPYPAPRNFIELLSAFVTKHLWKYESPGDAVPVEDGSRIQGFEDLKIIHTPGHTPGALSVLDPKTSVLFCGDAINNRRNRLTGPMKYFMYDMDLAQESIKKIASLDFQTLCPGHGKWVSDNVRQKVKDLLKWE